ncbi:MAG: helix-turn-helix domain-containing protein [Gammaproteobacteria bacterium]|jgi:transcriptional regulator with XRE-family HTH domain|nr:helix-turn-helix domain-containing protein [Gammaproteobacteria bacterium]
MKYQLLAEKDVQIALARFLRTRREQEKLSRDKLSERSTVPAATIKKFELTGQISLRQLLLLWQTLDDLKRIYELSQLKEVELPRSIDEVLNDDI